MNRSLRLGLCVFAWTLVAGFAAALYTQSSSLRAAHERLAALDAGAIEIGFAQAMSLHHQQAILMAKLLLDGQPTALAGLANGIAEAQLVELGEMRGWLRLWQQPWVAATRSMDWMLLGESPPDDALRQYLLDCENAPTGMVGLATKDELNRLRHLSGPARDQLFLELMLTHHRGGLPMAQFAAKESGLDAVRKLARQMAADQLAEMGRMQMMQQVFAETSAARDAAKQD